MNGKYPTLSEPDETYNGLVFAETFKGAAFTTRIRTVVGRDTGAVPSPLDSFLLMQGLETLGLRIERHASNAMAVAEHLKPIRKWLG